jgi:hypothetical protein
MVSRIFTDDELFIIFANSISHVHSLKDIRNLRAVSKACRDAVSLSMQSVKLMSPYVNIKMFKVFPYIIKINSNIVIYVNSKSDLLYIKYLKYLKEYNLYFKSFKSINIWKILDNIFIDGDNINNFKSLNSMKNIKIFLTRKRSIFLGKGKIICNGLSNFQRKIVLQFFFERSIHFKYYSHIDQIVIDNSNYYCYHSTRTQNLSIINRLYKNVQNTCKNILFFCRGISGNHVIFLDKNARDFLINSEFGLIDPNKPYSNLNSTVTEFLNIHDNIITIKLLAYLIVINLHLKYNGNIVRNIKDINTYLSNYLEVNASSEPMIIIRCLNLVADFYVRIGDNVIMIYFRKILNRYLYDWDFFPNLHNKNFLVYQSKIIKTVYETLYISKHNNDYYYLKSGIQYWDP